MVRDMEALESPNECDVPGNCNADRPSGVTNAINFLPIIHAEAMKLGIQLWGLPWWSPIRTPPREYFQRDH